MVQIHVSYQAFCLGYTANTNVVLHSSVAPAGVHVMRHVFRIIDESMPFDSVSYDKIHLQTLINILNLSNDKIRVFQPSTQWRVFILVLSTLRTHDVYTTSHKRQCKVMKWHLRWCNVVLWRCVPAVYAERKPGWHLVKSRPLRKHAYSNILKISPPRNWKFSDKNSDIIHISAQNIDCEAVLTSTHNVWFWAEIRKIMYTPVDPSFTI